MANKRPIIIFDLETSGLDETEQEIVQIAAKTINPWDLETSPVGEFNYWLKPENPEKAQKGAIKVLGDGWTKANNEGLEPKIVLSKFVDYIKSANPTKSVTTKPIMIAYNSTFDYKFLTHHLIKKNLVAKGDFGYEFPFSWVWDAMGFAFSIFESSDIENLKLDTVLSRLKLQRAGESHCAMEDVNLLAEFVKRYFQFQRECSKRMSFCRT